MRRAEHRLGFTLIEMLVVIAIIVLVAGMTLAMMGNIFKTQGLRGAGQIVSGAFSQTRQLAAAQRLTHFLFFPSSGGRLDRMSVYADTSTSGANTKNLLDGGDARLDAEIFLPRTIEFYPGTPIFTAPQAYVGFRPDGTMVLPTGVPDVGGGVAGQADLILWNPNRPERIYIDYVAFTGKIRKIEFYAQ